MQSKNVIILLAAAFLFYRLTAQRKNLQPGVEDPYLARRYNIHLIPGNKNNYRSGQIPKSKLAEFIKKYDIKTIVRLNGNNLDSQKYSSDPQTSQDEERKICEANGCKFVVINAHEGYQPGKGYVLSGEKAYQRLKEGNTLIHCLHGADRTGAMVGYYLKKSGIMPNTTDIWNYTTNLNSWKSYIKAGKFYNTTYAKYAETFIPIAEIKKLTK